MQLFINILLALTFSLPTYEDQTRFQEGVALIEKGRYEDGLKALEKTDIHRIGRYDEDDYRFYRGYAYLMIGRYNRADIYFNQLSKSDGPYTDRARYYHAVCMYRQDQYERALPIFCSLDSAGLFRESVPYFITQTYYHLGQRDSVLTRAESLIKQHPDSRYNSEMHRILGEQYFEQGNYALAEQHLTAYTGDPIRQDQLLLGVSQYQNGRYQHAVQTLRAVTQQRDSISQAAYMTMGHAQVKLGQNSQAKLSYHAASTIAQDEQTREQAMYNYALATYQSSTAMGEGVTAIMDFLRAYPQSEHRAEVYSLLCDAFLKSHNYRAALSALMEIDHPTAQMLATRQQLRYQLGVDAFAQSKWTDVKRWMSEVLTYAQANDRYAASAREWRGEAEYRLGEYADAELDAGSNDYLRGYAQFAQQKYDLALSSLLRYIETAPRNDETVINAECRIGDCYFIARHFADAIQHYSLVASTERNGADYALYHIGYAYGLLRQQREKAENLRTLVSRFPNSDYAARAWYEIARAEIAQDKQRDAILAYNQLIRLFPTSNLSRQASVERAMIYRNLGETETAIAAFKQTVTDYPGTDEAYTAIEGLEQICVQNNRLEEYLTFTANIQDMPITVNADSLTYVTVEHRFMNHDWKDEQEAIDIATQILAKQDIRTEMGAEACYVLAENYYRMGDHKRAEEFAQSMLESETQQQYWLAKALMLTAQIEYDRGDTFLAQQYLLTLQRNYDEDTLLVAQIQERLQAIERELNNELDNAQNPTNNER